MDNSRLVWILVLGLAIRFLFVTFFPPSEWYEDGIIAKNISSGLGFSLSGDSPTAYKAPVYPYLLAAIRLMVPRDESFLYAVGYLHVVLYVFSFVLITKIASFYFSDRVAAATGLVLALYPSYVYYVRVIEVTNIFVPVFSGALFFLLRLHPALKPQDFVLAGFWIGLSLLTNPISAVPIILTICCLLVLRRNFRRFKAGSIGLTTILVLLVLSPWVVRNWVVFKEFIAIKTPLYYNIYLGYTEETRDSAALFLEMPYAKASLMVNTGKDQELERLLKPLVFQQIRKDPLLYLKHCLSRLRQYWWVPRKYFGNNSLSFLVVRKMPVIVSLLATVVYLVFMLRKRCEFTEIMLLNLLAFSLIYSLIFAGNIRFKLDIEWIQLIATGYVLSSVWGKKATEHSNRDGHVA